MKLVSRYFKIKNLLLVLPLIAISCGTEQEEGQVQRTGAPLNVEGFVIRPVLLENIVPATGSILANEEVELRSEISGTVEQITFEEGTYVSAGSNLVSIDDDELQAQIRKFDAQIKLAESEEYRNRELLEIKGISEEVYEQSQTRLEELKADRALVEAQISNSRIFAPFSGKVGLRLISKGDFLQPGTPIAYFVQTNPVKIEFTIPENYASLIKPGMSVDFSVAGVDSVFMAEVYAIEPRIDPISRMLKVRARCSNPDDLLIPGSFARVQVNLDVIENAVLVPTEAIVPQLNVQLVYVINNGRAEARNVETGIRKERLVQIVSGIEIGDTVVTTGLLAMKEGMPIRIGEIRNDQ